MNNDDRDRTILKRVQHYSPASNSPNRFERVVGTSGCQEKDWGALLRAADSQIAFAEFIAAQMPPEAMGVIYAPGCRGKNGLLHRVELWREQSECVYPSLGCPSRTRRHFEYILGVERGPNPRKALRGQLHGHILLYNLGETSLEYLAAQWRSITGIEDQSEPRLKPYSPGPEGILYSLKTWGTDADQITFSEKLPEWLSRNAPDMVAAKRGGDPEGGGIVYV